MDNSVELATLKEKYAQLHSLLCERNAETKEQGKKLDSVKEDVNELKTGFQVIGTKFDNMSDKLDTFLGKSVEKEEKQSKAIDQNCLAIGILKATTAIWVLFLSCYLLGAGKSYMENKKVSNDYSKKTKQAYIYNGDRSDISFKV